MPVIYHYLDPVTVTEDRYKILIGRPGWFATPTMPESIKGELTGSATTVAHARKPVTNNLWVASAIANRTDNGTGRTKHRVMTTCADLRFTWGAHYTSNPNAGAGAYGTDADFPADIVIKASVEVGGAIYRLLFNGNDTATLKPGARVTTDPLGVEVSAGTDIYVRTFITSSNWYGNTANFAGDGTDGGWTTTTDLTAPGSAAVGNSTHWQFAPMLITGRPSTSARVVGIIGDSLSTGTGEDASGTAASSGWGAAGAVGGGFIMRALTAASLPHVNIGHGGERMHLFADFANRFRRITYLDDCTHVICEGGVNDVFAGRTLAQVQAALVSTWSLCAQRGIRAWQTTITPSTTSTDSFATVENQTTANAGREAVRVQLNTWLRNGAPLVNGVAVVPGVPNAVLVGQGTHPLKGVFEIADLAESARDSGKWKAASTADGLHPNSVMHMLLSSGIDTTKLRLS